jgi:hypothetical protein
MSNQIFLLAVILVITIGTMTMLESPYRVKALIDTSTGERSRAPSAISENGIYIAWWSNKTGNDEVMFRASTDGGNTFSNKIDLSNTTSSNSTRVEIAADGGNVIVTWWETNQTDDIAVAKMSTDFGKTFGPLLILASNGTIGTGEAKSLP